MLIKQLISRALPFASYNSILNGGRFGNFNRGWSYLSVSDYTGTMLASKILIPVDGSPASLRALDYTIKMATQNPGSSFAA
jgi:hypothetical protein